MKYLFFQIFLYCIFVGFLKAALQCPSEGKWIMKSFDNSSFFCYTIIELESNAKELQTDDICKRNAHPSSKIASIHSQAENDFLMQNFYGAMIGFWIPKKLKWNPANFQWSDGSNVDFIGWDIKGIPKQPDNQIPAERFVKLRKKFKSSGWHDYQFKEMKKVLCKMNAFENTKTSSENTTPLSTTEKTDTSTTKIINKELEVTSTSDKTPDTISTRTSTAEPAESTTTPSATTSTVSESIQSTTTETTAVSSTKETEVIAETTTTTFIDKDIVILDGAQP